MAGRIGGGKCGHSYVDKWGNPHLCGRAAGHNGTHGGVKKYRKATESIYLANDKAPTLKWKKVW